MRLSVPQIHGSDAGIAPNAGISASATLLTPAFPQQRRRRPSRSRETGDRHIRAAVRDGFRVPEHTDEVLQSLEDHPEYAQGRSDLRRGLRRCVEALIGTADFSTMTTRATKAKLADLLGVCRRTVNRYMAQLREWGLVGMVANGRSAAYASVGEDGRRINEAAVHVLCVPEGARRVLRRAAQLLGLGASGRRRQINGLVEESVTPPSEAGLYLRDKKVLPRTHARGRISQSKEQKRLGCSVDQIRWNRHRVPANRTQQRTAAWRLKSLLPNVLGKMSDRDIASCVRDFFAAGWSVADLHHALEARPDGSAWPYSGAPDTKEPHRVRGWLKFRLAAWRDEADSPVRSRGQRDRLERERVHRERQAQDEAEQQHRKQVSGDSEIKRRSLAKIRAVLSRR